MLLAAAGMFAACESQSITCPADPARVDITIAARSLAVGESYLAPLSVMECGGTRSVAFSGFWRSTNVQVATVDSLSGVITGIASGSTVIYAQQWSLSHPSGLGTYDSLLVTVP